jgi:hypothetical protein
VRIAKTQADVTSSSIRSPFVLNSFSIHPQFILNSSSIHPQFVLVSFSIRLRLRVAAPHRETVTT